MIKPVVFGTGPKTASIALIGEAPGANEIAFHKPFIGAAGSLLTKLMHEAGIARNEVYITNVIKERPGHDDNDVSSWFTINNKGDVWTSEGYNEYVELLRKELMELPNLAVCVPLGNTALYALTGLVKIGKRRGSILPATLLPVKCVPTIHPSAAFREYIFTYYIRFDLKRALAESATKELIPTERKIVIEPPFHEVMQFLDKVITRSLFTRGLNVAVEANSVGNDIEVVNEELDCISLSLSPSEGISIPFMLNGHNYFPPDQELAIMKKLSVILENKNIKKVGQNYIFDMSFLFRKYGIVVNNYECTMIAQGIVYPDFPKGLDFITSIYTREPYYKDDGKKWFKLGGSYQNFWIYNAKDSLTCQESFSELIKRLEAQGNMDTYLRQRDLIHPLMFMQARGMKVNVEGKNKASAEADVKISGKLKELCTLVKCDTALKINDDPETYRVVNHEDGLPYDMTKSEYTRHSKNRPTLNAGSSQQLARLFYDKLGHAPYHKKGSVTTDDDALKRLVRKGVKEAIIIRDIRKVVKLKGTYYDMKLSNDGRLRSAMNPIGTVSGRLSSSQDIFGEGGNVQNLPKVMQNFILADEDYIMYVCDLSQAENRTTANIAPEPLMIKAFADGVDIHSLTASMISGIPADEIKKQDKEQVLCPLGTGEYTWRFWGKKCNHSLNYDLGYKTFALRFEMSEPQAKQIVERFHRVYPGIRQYHAWVRRALSAGSRLVNCYGRVRVFLDRWGDDLFKEAYSWIPQSSIADKMNIEGINYVYYNQQLFHHLELLNQIHDSLVFQIPISIGFKEHANMLIRIKRSLESPVVWHDHSFVIPLDFKMGLSMGSMKTVEIDNAETIEGLANKLHGLYGELGTTSELPSVDRDLSDSSSFAEEMFA